MPVMVFVVQWLKHLCIMIYTREMSKFLKKMTRLQYNAEGFGRLWLWDHWWGSGEWGLEQVHGTFFKSQIFFSRNTILQCLFQLNISIVRILASWYGVVFGILAKHSSWPLCFECNVFIFHTLKFLVGEISTVYHNVKSIFDWLFRRYINIVWPQFCSGLIEHIVNRYNVLKSFMLT